MALLPPERVDPLLVCPRCRSSLRREGQVLRCSSAECPFAARDFPRVGTHPVLVDFERSILEEQGLLRTQGTTLVPRGHTRGPMRWLRNLTSPPNRVAERHATLLARMLREQGDRKRVLVVGGGTVGDGAASLYADREIEIVAFDIYASPWTQFIADAHAIPLEDRSVDAVWVQAVLEHVLDPWHVVSEIERVLRPGGLVYSETPFLQHVHEGPYDFTRFTESGHRWLFRRFDRLDSGVVAGSGTQLEWTIVYTTRGVFRSPLISRVVQVATSWVRILDHLIPERYGVDGACCVFFFGRKAERTLTPAEIVSHYRGAQRPRAARRQ